LTKNKNITILLVEDDILIARLEKRQLENKKYQVVHVKSGEEAIENIFKKKESYDCILMDIDLGDGMNGSETSRQILKEIDVPIIFLSSNPENDIINKFDKTEIINSYGIVLKNSGIIILDISIKIALRLFNI
jgi:CheY-like chemotaxis protein